MRMAFNFPGRRTRTAAIVLVTLAGIMACGSDPNSSPAEATTPDPTDPTSTSTAPSGSAPLSDPTTPPDSPATTPETAPSTRASDDLGAIGPTVQRLVDMAAADLVERFTLSGLSLDNPIVITAVEEVTWRDGALGCPSKDMQYAQVLTPGHRIVLEFDGATYNYHAGGGHPFYCARPETPAPSD